MLLAKLHRFQDMLSHRLTLTGFFTIRDSAVTIVGIVVVQRSVCIDIAYIVGISRVRGAQSPVTSKGLTASYSKAQSAFKH